MTVIRRKDRDCWMVHIKYRHPDGTVAHIRRRSPVNTRRGAERYERDIRQALLDGSFGRKEETEVVPILTEFAEEFMTNYAEVHNKRSEILAKRSTLRNHLIPSFGNKRLDAIQARDIARYKMQKLKQGLSKKTVNNQLVILGRLLAIAIEWEIIEKAPKMNMLKVPKPDFDFLDFEEAERLIAATTDDWRPMILMALRTGMRLGELLAIRWEDIDLVTKRILVRRNAVYGAIGTPKSGKNREIPLCDSLLDELKNYRHLKGELVFSNARGKMWLAQDTYSPLHYTCRKAGLRKVGWHTLRHSFASHLVMLGAPIKAVQELLGHSTLEMTMRYAHLSPDAKRDAVQLLDKSAHSRITIGSPSGTGDFN
ncbi:MAG: tyrosine-type recombinase/integrase [Myxococcota bacterium]|nr:tyrosine-type recombinase/integrase [Myxococcota bacterium]